MRVLVVDDSSAITRLIEMCLKGEGHEVLIACDGQEALRVAAVETLDLILMDVEMPQMNGLDAVERLKHNQKTAGIPVIMLTARTDPGDILQSLRAGADMHLTKPFKCEELVAIIQRIYPA